MPLVKCVHCGSETDPVLTANYCDDCGKRLPGFLVPRPDKEPPRADPAVPFQEEVVDDGGPEIPDSPLWAWLVSGAIVLPFVALFAWLRVTEGRPNDTLTSLRGILLLSAGVGLVLTALASALQGAFASDKQLRAMSHWIGVKTPASARLVCWGFIGLIAVLDSIAGVILVNVG